MKLIIFDIDGTLSNTVNIDDLAFLVAFKEVFGIKEISTEWQEYGTTTDTGLSKAIVRRYLERDIQPDEARIVKARFLEVLQAAALKDPSQFSEVSGSKAITEYLKDHSDFKMGIATGAWRDSALIKLNGVGIEATGIPFGNSDISDTRVGIIKSVIQQAQEKWPDITFEKTIYVGDGVWDFEASQACEIGFVGIDFRRNDKLKRAGAQHILHDYSDMNLFFEKIENC